MDRDKDDEIYHEQFLTTEVDSLYKRKILHSRILNLSLPENCWMYGRIGKELLNSGQPQKSLPWLKRALIIWSDDTSVQINLAKALFKLEKESEAFSFIKKQLSEGRDLHPFLIETLEEKQRLQDLESFTKEIANIIADPEDISIFYYYIAYALVCRNKYPEALVNYQKAFENNSPMKRRHHEAYGVALYHEGFFEEALTQFEHVRRFDPNDKLAYNNIAHLNYCLGRVEKAREGFEYILENGLKATSTYANLILVLLHLNQDEEVISQYKDLLRPSLNLYCGELKKRYQEELRVTQVVLQRDNIDVKTKEFNAKKLEGINILLSFFD